MRFEVEAESGAPARLVFAARLTELFQAAGNPTLQRVARAAEERMRAARPMGERGSGTVQRVSDWRSGRNVPSRFDTLVPVLLTLFELTRMRADGAGAELVDLVEWERVWSAAQREPTLRRTPVVVNALRRDVGTIVGREAELRRIVDAAGARRVVNIHTVDGMAGVGKTALVTRAAHLLASRFPDGRYFVELNAHTPGRDPADPADVLGTLLTDVGVDPRNLPETIAARRDLWRDRVNGKRILLVLDDARDHAQIEELLPAAEGCLTLITSRRRLLALDGAAPITLDPLERDAAVELFCRLADRPATSENTSGAAEIVHLCGYLPLAIVLLAGRLAHRPRWSVADLAAEFRRAHDRLAELEAGPRAVRAAFTTSYGLLSADRRRLFRRLGAHPGPDFDRYAVAALDDTTVDEARKALEELYVEHLIDETAPGRYRLHDLLREYAQGLLTDPAERADAGARVLAYYLHTAHAATQTRHTGTASHPDTGAGARTRSAAARPPARTDAAPAQPHFASFRSASSWLRVERANMLACLRHAAAAGPLSQAMAMAKALVAELYLHGNWRSHAMAVQRRMAVAADSIDPRGSEAFALKDLGAVAYLADDYGVVAELLGDALAVHTAEPEVTAAAEQLRAALWLLDGEFATGERLLTDVLARYRALGDRHREGRALSDLGWARHLQGDYAGAAEALEQALALQREIGDQEGIAVVLNGLSWIRLLTGDRGSAHDMLREAARLNRALGQPGAAAVNVSALAWAQHLDGDYLAGIELLREARSLFRAAGNRSGEAFTSANLAYCEYVRGRHEGALTEAERAQAIYRELDNSDGVASALNIVGRVRARAGEAECAVAAITEALETYRITGNRVGVADSLANLGWVRQPADAAAAEELLRAALASYRELRHFSGVTETLNRLGAVRRLAGDPEAGLALHEEALELARVIGNVLWDAAALDGIGRCRAASGDRAGAVTALRGAVERYRRLEMAETDSAATLLDSLADPRSESPE
ncbi:tetratricopeptide repeat protein [Nocardia yamanashiensis]|uniref:tetratricopeptide repeat protein n=1 Tax=Nocardia yamanashiensis TaxID=209247 RepID=UPI001E33D139|nr:tetratricopeptide repeat protein [Nocardia yamanashiensis]UGT44396.1 tetratricopeptide repeat protein [Nocardia yamanashiensis]